MRVERQRSTEPRARLSGVTETALDHPAVEELERVARPESQRVFGVGQRLRAAAVALQRPGKDVVAVDAGPRALRRPGKRMPWSTWNSAISKSVLTPFAASSRRIAPISAYSRAAADRFAEIL